MVHYVSAGGQRCPKFGFCETPSNPKQSREPLPKQVFHVARVVRKGNCMTDSDIMAGISRRFFLSSGAALGAPLAISPRPKDETVYHFATNECDVQMSVEFYDRYARDGFWFAERRANRHFCLSANDQEGGDCPAN